MEVSTILQLFASAHTIGQVANSCNPDPSWWQISAIVSLLVASGILVSSTGVGLIGVATTLVGLITAGASIEATVAALGTHIAVIEGSTGVVAALIFAMRKILGC